MRVRCIASSGSALPASCIDEPANITRDTEFPLTVGSDYVVYGTTMHRGHCWYYVFDDNKLTYPVWKLAPLFEVSDPALPHDWIVGYTRSDNYPESYPVFSFPEWALDHYFYERLVDGDATAVAIFAARRVSAEQVRYDGLGI